MTDETAVEEPEVGEGTTPEDEPAPENGAGDEPTEGEEVAEDEAHGSRPSSGMTDPQILALAGILALALGLIDVYRSRGENLAAWGVAILGGTLAWVNLSV